MTSDAKTFDEGNPLPLPQRVALVEGAHVRMASELSALDRRVLVLEQTDRSSTIEVNVGRLHSTGVERLRGSLMPAARKAAPGLGGGALGALVLYLLQELVRALSH